MRTYQTGDQVVVARPQQPTGHRGGELGTVLAIESTPDGQLVQLLEETSGNVVGVWAHELDPR